MFRYKWGDTNPRECRVEDAHVIEIGDLLYLDTDSVRPVIDLSSHTTETIAQVAVHDLFVGVAMQRHAVGDGIINIRVATTGVFQYACASTSFEMGELIGVGTVTDFTPVNQLVATLDNAGEEDESLGKCVRRTVSATTVLIAILSTIYHDGHSQMA